MVIDERNEIMNMAELTLKIGGYIWSLPLIIIALFSGLLFSVRMGFPQIRRFPDMLRYLFKSSDSTEGISSFQGFAMALGGRIGVGNIAGVATAIFYGGPGAIFWMWVIAFVGAGSAFAESSLAQIYKTKTNGEYRGGPAFYIEKGLKCVPFAVLFAIVSVIANGLTGPTIQAFNIADACKNAFGFNPVIVGGVVAAVFALIVFGGMKRIGKVAELVVPVMAILYIVIAIIVMVVNYDRIGEMFKLIFTCAFNMNAVFGAIWGQAVMWGVKRGIYSNEAGMGSGAHAAASSEVSHPAKQGLAQAFSVYVDTLLVCTATAIMIMSTGCYNVSSGRGTEMIVSGLKGVDPGVGYTQAAIDSWIPGLGSAFIAVAITFFSFTTLMSFAFYTDAGMSYILRKKDEKIQRKIITVFLVILTAIIWFGATRSNDVAWNMADIGVGLSSWVNFIAIILLSPIVIRVYKDFERQRKLGLDPVFVPEDIGIDNAEIWDEITETKYADLLEAKEKAEGSEGSK